ncbi:hypothetical protein CAPTEDRAFT_202036 [Capitella teleta]|uniref:Uncharacterized protein n=1 Tax=Capitella teleta TaxID=283909 RepID=R7TB26_CAPTE|nr:hypothetical protein CAPTEDRAFT_202036 [Capitella teleta]|eukprot:ELT88692.1 hypothetical protein CAPTEDRAFT_202036 [Capitella teleta]
MEHQRNFLQPAVKEVWLAEQKAVLQVAKQAEGRAAVGGGSRCDSPGHCAKFGSYYLMDLQSGKIIDVQVVQQRSGWLLPHGVGRPQTLLEDPDRVKVKTLDTDRHVQIRSYIKKDVEMKDVDHRFDVWHIAKSFRKKMLALSARKECSEHQGWIKSANVHHNQGDPLFPSCLHGDLEDAPPRAWMQPSTPTSCMIEDLVSTTQMRKDIPMLSPMEQTSELEAYHSIVNQFSPKMIGFSYFGMICRIYLSALHYNKNVNRRQATLASGEKRWRVEFPKSKRGDYVVRRGRFRSLTTQRMRAKEL